MFPNCFTSVILPRLACLAGLPKFRVYVSFDVMNVDNGRITLHKMYVLCRFSPCIIHQMVVEAWLSHCFEALFETGSVHLLSQLAIMTSLT
jgi:hypothetical protein